MLGKTVIIFNNLLQMKKVRVAVRFGFATNANENLSKILRNNIEKYFWFPKTYSR